MATVRARFIEPMLLQLTTRLPEGAQWLYELKLDGYRAIAYKAGGKARLRSRNDKDFTARYPLIAEALSALPDDTVIDGEVVAMDETGKPSFNLLQNLGSQKTSLVYYVFDVLILAGRDVMNEPLSLRRELLQREIMPKLRDPVRESAILDACLPDLITAVKAQGLEGLVAKRRDSRYEPGQRSGAWAKMRVNQAQEFVIGGYTVGGRTFESLVFGYYDGQHLIYVARTRNSFTPSSREALFRKFKGLEISQCPFANLPEARSGRWGEGLTADKMKDCVWLRPLLIRGSQPSPRQWLEHSVKKTWVVILEVAEAVGLTIDQLHFVVEAFGDAVVVTTSDMNPPISWAYAGTPTERARGPDLRI